MVVAIFAAAGSWPAPDTNEPHYLTKARHFHDPAWCAGDFFLETPEAHHVFYRAIGPVAAAMPLERAAWIGRIAGWIAVAIGIEWVLVQVVDRAAAFSPWRVLAAAVWSLAMRHTPASGEWVIGGCEGKVFAWAMVYGAAGWFAAGRPATAWLACGAATAVHAVVGGWGMVATALATAASRSAGARPTPATAAMVVVGVLVAAIGVVPGLSLSRGVTRPEAAEAVRTYVVDRFPHHLLVETFADGMMARHVLAIAVAIACMAIVPRSRPLDRLALFVGAAVTIAIAGCVVTAIGGVWPEASRALLRFYWFRLSDGLVPLLLAASATLAIRQGLAWPAGRACLASLLLILGLDLANESRHWPLPGRSVPSRADRHVAAADWEEVCGWVRDNTPPDARFLTPRGSASFQWRTGRPEVVSWKHSPQDFAGVLEWRRRLFDCFARDGDSIRGLERSTAALGIARLRDVASRYDADYCIAPLADVDPADPLPVERVHANGTYGVYRLIDP